MRIIENGIDRKEVEHVARCRHCECQFAFKVSEAIVHTSVKNETFFVVNCPWCKKELWIEQS